MANKFTCKNCGSANLALRRYAKCLIPVIMSNGAYEYLEPIIDIDDYITSENCYCCFNCGNHVGNYEEPVQTEKELLEYLNCEAVSHKKF